MAHTCTISNLVHGHIDPKDPSSLDWTPIVKVKESKISWQLEAIPDTSAYYIRLKANAKHTEGKIDAKEEYLGATSASAKEERWFISKDNKGNFMIHRAAGEGVHAHWELSSSEINTKVELEGGHDYGESSNKLGKFLKRVVQPNSGLTLDDYEDDIDNDAFWEITPPPF